MTKKDQLFPYLILIPALTIMGTVLVYPLINGIVLAFTDYTMFNPSYKLVGFKNIVSNFQSKVFWEIFSNSIIIVFSSVIIQLLLGLSVALLLFKKIFLRNFFRSAVFLIWILPEMVVALLWMIMYNSDFGILNFVLKQFGIISENIIWLNDPIWSRIALILVYGWRGTPFHMVLILAALQTIPKEIIESSKIDGAGNFKRFIHITIPYIKHIILLAFLLSVVRAFQDITQIFVLTNGGPIYSTTTLAIEVYKQAFTSFQLGKAASIGITWMLFLIILSIFYIRLITREESR